VEQTNYQIRSSSSSCCYFSGAYDYVARINNSWPGNNTDDARAWHLDVHYTGAIDDDLNNIHDSPADNDDDLDNNHLHNDASARVVPTR
jgi:hypothetical protein